MKNLILSFAAFIAVSFTSFGQAPEGFKYQAVVRDAGNTIITNQNVGMQIVIHQGSVGGTAVYTETFAITSNGYGLVNLEIGTGTTTDDFSTIDWATGLYYIETLADLTGGVAYNSMGTSQLMSVPYALYAKTSGNGQGPAGPTGAPGSDGAVGPAGPIGPAGAPGLDGADGAVGPAGPTGAPGSDGADGAVGPAGPIGPTGAPGSDGADGAVGPTGPTGAPGAPGSDGLDGAVGSGGPMGPTGAPGSDGAVGPAGAANMTGTADYVVKFTGASAGGNSQIRDNGTSVSVGIAPIESSQLYVRRTQLTATGDGQSTLFGYRTRDSQNDGTSYSQSGTNLATKGYNYWGDDYSFGVGGFSYNDYNRTGGVIGAYQGGTYWGSLGYKNSASATYGVYGSAGYDSGGGFLPTGETIGVGGGFFGDMIGSTSQGSVIGQLNSGDLFAQYNKGNVYTLGKNVELIQVNENITPLYSVSSIEATIYAKGSIQLANGTAYIAFSDEYKSLLGETPVITATPNGECNGVYVSSIDKEGFMITELMNGSSNATISWIAVGNRIDNDKMELATQIVSSSSFDRNVQQVLFSDGNLEGSAKGMWWDGATIQFGEIPTHLTTVDRKDETK